MRIQNQGNKFHSKHFLVIAVETDHRSLRFGLTVTKKIDSRAVVRNRIKRRIREFLRTTKGRFSTGFDVVIVAKRGAESCLSEQIERELFGLIKRAGIVKNA